MPVLRIMGPEGDRPVTWDVRDMASIADAQKEFVRCREEGRAVYRVTDAERGDGEVVTVFEAADPHDLVAIVPIQGG